MIMTGFDPFNCRLARDIRNTLSKIFLQALKDNNIEKMRQCALKYLDQGLTPAYEIYIRERMSKYEKVFTRISQEKNADILQQARIFWDQELYFEMHELLEPIWKEAGGTRKRALQGLIRAAGMKTHAEHNNMKAAVSMGRKALDDLKEYNVELAGFSGLQSLIADIQKTLVTFS